MNATGAGDGNRTHVASLEGWSSAIELHPLVLSYDPVDPPHPPPRQDDPGALCSTRPLVEGVGFEPT